MPLRPRAQRISPPQVKSSANTFPLTNHRDQSQERLKKEFHSKRKVHRRQQLAQNAYPLSLQTPKDLLSIMKIQSAPCLSCFERALGKLHRYYRDSVSSHTLLHRDNWIA